MLQCLLNAPSATIFLVLTFPSRALSLDDERWPSSKRGNRMTTDSSNENCGSAAELMSQEVENFQTKEEKLSQDWVTEDFDIKDMPCCSR